MLIAYLPDTRAVIGLGVLHARRAEPALTLRGCLKHGGPEGTCTLSLPADNGLLSLVPQQA